jgi:hypothetical protein
MLKFIYHPCALPVVLLARFIEFIWEHESLYPQIQNLETTIESTPQNLCYAYMSKVFYILLSFVGMNLSEEPPVVRGVLPNDQNVVY